VIPKLRHNSDDKSVIVALNDETSPLSEISFISNETRLLHQTSTSRISNSHDEARDEDDPPLNFRGMTLPEQDLRQAWDLNYLQAAIYLKVRRIFIT
jgi:hypothetical protein